MIPRGAEDVAGRRFAGLAASLGAGLFGVCLAAALFVAAALAQTADPDWEVWDREAEIAQETIDLGAASADALAGTRERIEAQRAAAAGISAAAARDAERLETELEALGPAPENAPEAPDAAALRADLSEQLADALARRGRADRVVARAQQLRADLAALDQRRFVDRLTRLGPSPADPTTWAAAGDLLSSIFGRMGREITRALSAPATREMAVRQAPLALFALGIAAFLAFGLRRAAVGAILRRAQSEGRGRRRLMLGIGASAARLLFVVIAAASLLFGIASTGLLGPAGEAVLSGFARGLAALVIAYALGATLFSSAAAGMRPYAVTDAEAGAAFRWTMLAGLAVALGLFFARIGGAAADGAPAMAPLDFIAVALAGVALFRLARILGPVIERSVDGEAIAAPPALRFMRRFALTVSVAAPGLALIGYMDAAAFLIFPTLRSLALIAVLGLFYFVVREGVDIYLAGGRDEGGERLRLIPIFAGFVLICAALPILAVIWGAGWSDLKEAYAAVGAGFSIGDVKLSPMDFVTFALVFGAGYTLTRMIQRALKSSVLPKAGMSAGAADALTSGLGYLGVFLAAIAAISAAGLDLSNLAIVAGALSVGIGFGLQAIVNNFVSGVILLVERPIKVGDWIDVGGAQGYVKKVNVRSTEIETFDRASYIMPNSDLISSPVLNWTHGNTLGRVIAPVGVAYGTDPRLVERLLLEVARDHPMIVASPAPAAYFMAFGSDALEFELRAYLRDVNWMLTVRSDVNFKIAKRFEEEGIEIPFAQSDVTLRNPEAVAAALRDLAQSGMTPPPAPTSPAPTSPPGGAADGASFGSASGVASGSGPRDAG